MEPRPRHIVIIGGGVIGCSTAYFLTRHPSFNSSIHHIILVEATDIASAASGKAGGLLGKWAYPECLVPLSYRLHEELAAEHEGARRWGYRRVQCGRITAKVKRQRLSLMSQAKRDSIIDVQQLAIDLEGAKPWQKLPKQDSAATKLLRKSVLPPDLDWFDGQFVQGYDEMGLPGYTETAQVHPLHFTHWMAHFAREGGVDVRTYAKVTKIDLNQDGTSVSGVEYLDRSRNEMRYLRGVTDVIVATGPWTDRLLPKSQVGGIRAHSVVFAADVSPYAVFTSITLPNDWVPAHRAARGERRRHKGLVDPEVYARPDGEVYACGEPDMLVPLPETADMVECDESQCDDMAAYLGTVSNVLHSAPIAAKQACYMPRHMRDGVEAAPIIGRTSTTGLWVAAGHTCWGIQNGPATGKLMSEFILDGEAKSADVSSLDPRHYHI